MRRILAISVCFAIAGCALERADSTPMGGPDPNGSFDGQVDIHLCDATGACADDSRDSLIAVNGDQIVLGPGGCPLLWDPYAYYDDGTAWFRRSRGGACGVMTVAPGGSAIVTASDVRILLDVSTAETQGTLYAYGTRL